MVPFRLARSRGTPVHLNVQSQEQAWCCNNIGLETPQAEFRKIFMTKVALFIVFAREWLNPCTWSRVHGNADGAPHRSRLALGRSITDTNIRAERGGCGQGITLRAGIPTGTDCVRAGLLTVLEEGWTKDLTGILFALRRVRNGMWDTVSDQATCAWWSVSQWGHLLFMRNHVSNLPSHITIPTAPCTFTWFMRSAHLLILAPHPASHRNSQKASENKI